jgi:predicted dienelactone hydrolase
MRPLAFLAVLIACFAAPMAEAAGFRFIDIPADASGPALTGAVWSPCAAPPQEIKFRFVTIPAVQNCPVVGDRLPLIVLSHGSGGWFGAHRDTAAMLADAGFVVAAVNHPGDNTTDRSRSDTLSILLDRPTDIRRLTDFMLDAWPEASKLDRERIGFFGFSRGAYTGLVIAVAGSTFQASSRSALKASSTGCAPRSGRARSRPNARLRIHVSRPPFWPTWSSVAPSRSKD